MRRPVRPDRHQGPFLLLGQVQVHLGALCGVRLRGGEIRSIREDWRNLWEIRFTEHGPNTLYGAPGPVLWEYVVRDVWDDVAAELAAETLIARHAAVLGEAWIARTRELAAASLRPPVTRPLRYPRGRHRT